MAVCVFYGMVGIGKDLLYGVASLRSLSEYILAAWWHIKLDTSYAGSFLSSVMLFLHKQVQLV